MKGAKMLIDGEKVMDFLFYDEEREKFSIKSGRIIDFLETYSIGIVPTIDIPTGVAIVVHEDGTVSKLVGVKI